MDFFDDVQISKKCPFCGSEKIEVIQRPQSSYYAGTCGGCLATGPVSVNRNIAIEWWDRRKQDVVG